MFFSKFPLLSPKDTASLPPHVARDKDHHNCAAGWRNPQEGLRLPKKTISEVPHQMTRNNIKQSSSVCSYRHMRAASQISINSGKYVWDEGCDFKRRLGGIHGIPFESVPGETPQRERQLTFREAHLPHILY